MGLLIKVQGEANAQGIFDLLNADGMHWTKHAGGWHFLRCECRISTADTIIRTLRELCDSTRMFFTKEA